MGLFTAPATNTTSYHSHSRMRLASCKCAQYFTIPPSLSHGRRVVPGEWFLEGGSRAISRHPTGHRKGGRGAVPGHFRSWPPERGKKSSSGPFPVTPTGHRHPHRPPERGQESGSGPFPVTPTGKGTGGGLYFTTTPSPPGANHLTELKGGDIKT